MTLKDSRSSLCKSMIDIAGGMGNCKSKWDGLTKQSLCDWCFSAFSHKKKVGESIFFWGVVCFCSVPIKFPAGAAPTHLEWSMGWQTHALTQPCPLSQLLRVTLLRVIFLLYL